MAKRELRINLLRASLLVVFVMAVALAAFWLLAREDLYGMIYALRGADYFFVASAVGVYFFSTAIWALRWRLALSSVGHQVGLRDLYQMIHGGIFINNVTPMVRVGGDPFGRAYFLRKLKGIPYSSGFATVVGEHAFDLPVLFSFLMLGLVLFFRTASVWLAFVLVGIWISAAFVLALLPFHILRKRMGARGLSGVMIRFFKRFRKRVDKMKIVREIEGFYSSAQATISGRKNVLSIAGLSIALWSLDVLRFWFVFQALAYDPPFAMLLLASTLPMIVGLIPFLPGGLVLVEGTLISVFMLFDVPLSLALAATLIERAISFVLVTLVGAGMLSYLGIKLWARN